MSPPKDGWCCQRSNFFCAQTEQEILRKRAIEQKLNFLDSQRERAGNRGKEWRESIEGTDVAHRPARVFAHSNESSLSEMSYMLGLIHCGNQTRPIEQPFNKWPRTSIVGCCYEELSAWICQFVK